LRDAPFLKSVTRIAGLLQTKHMHLWQQHG
jgi:hypothetical protein